MTFSICGRSHFDSKKLLLNPLGSICVCIDGVIRISHSYLTFIAQRAIEGYSHPDQWTYILHTKMGDINFTTEEDDESIENFFKEMCA